MPKEALIESARARWRGQIRRFKVRIAGHSGSYGQDLQRRSDGFGPSDRRARFDQSFLKQRVVTSLVLAPLVAAGVLWLPTYILSLLFGLLALVAGWEWSALSGWRSNGARVAYTLALLGVLVGAWFAMPYQSGVWAGLALGLGVWAFGLLWLVYPIFEAGRMMKSLAGLAVLGCAWMTMIWIHGLGDQGSLWVLYLLALVWVADSGAYFVGRSFGRHKLAPRISPGKTWEGVYGALGAVGVYAWVVAEWVSMLPVWPLVAVSILVALVSVVGDLLESLLKRQAGLKDSGVLLPGHGGVLDRVDGLLAAVPVFVVGLLVWPVL